MTARKRRMLIPPKQRAAIAKRFRRLRGPVSQADQAVIIGMTQQKLSRYERGEGMPSTEALFTIAVKTKVSIDWLMFGKGGMWLE